MDTENKTEDSEQHDKAQEESSLPDATPEENSNKRKLSEAGDSDNDQDAKKMKMEEEEKGESGDGDEDSAEKEDTAGETEEDKAEEDKDQKPDEKPSSPAAKEEVKNETGDKDEESAESAGQSQQDDEAMDVEESAAEKDTVSEEGKEGKEEEPQSTEKTENNEESKEEAQSDKSEPKPAASESEKEEKTEVVQRRYPMRHRRGEDKAASQSAKASGSASDGKRSGSSGTSRDDDSHKGTRAGSVKSDSGSDKENMNSDTAADMGNAGTPDVIMLSEEEETEQWKEKKAKKRKLVRRLQAHLRNEEAKLVLLKKLRQSQLTPQVQDHTPVSNSSSSQLSKQATPRQQGGPPPLVRGGQQVRGSSLHLQQQQQSRTPSQGQMRNIQGPPPLVVTPRMGSSNSGANGHGSQNLRNNTPHLNQHGSSGLRPVQQQPTTTTPQHQQAATPPQVDTQTPAQRQAAAKLALRKQLEKTLLQIPPPKPPAPEMNFIPSLACPDFVLLLGLEEVVNHIIDLQLIARGQKSPDEKFICNPFTCVQCNTDYTPVWKREKPGSKNVICEHCVTWNQKRALKQEHTNRLKSAFVKALQQEQEIERMQAQTPSNPSTPTPTPSGTPPTSASSSAPPQALAAAAAASNVAAAAAMSMNPASFRHSAEQVRQHHSFLQAQAQLRAGQPLPGLQGFGPRSTFPYNLPYVKQADLQRQYLLDLMPRTAGMPWKQ